jgi:hypothetical protein
VESIWEPRETELGSIMEFLLLEINKTKTPHIPWGSACEGRASGTNHVQVPLTISWWVENSIENNKPLLQKCSTAPWFYFSTLGRDQYLDDLKLK